MDERTDRRVMFIPKPVATVLPDGSVRHPVITICGSTRFKDEIIKAVGELTHAGWLVFPVGITEKSRVLDNATVVLLNDIHQQKIRMSDAIYVVNKDGYIGKSTANEIRYAELWMRTIYYMEGGETDVDANAGRKEDQ
ncbi:MAG: hypothetical protein NC311_06745 [Muribaculaceae bacterium]|nr:hypothetical protein [Muribaculaceae bacterium]